MTGMNDHVAKPVNVNLFYATLARWIRPGMRQGIIPESLVREEAGDTDFPSRLPGLAVQDGLGRLNGNAGLYRKLIIGFARENNDLADRLGALLESSDLSAARVLTHTLKGVAGNISALHLAETAKTMEAALKNGRPEEARLLLPSLEADLAEIMESAATLSNAESATATAMTKIDDPETLALLLRELSQLLEMRDMKALDVFDALGPSLEAALPFKTAALARAIDKLDFTVALGLLHDIAAQMNITLTLPLS